MEITNFKLFSGLTPQQKEERKLGIGGSDVAAVLGQSKYKTPLDIYQDKMGYAEAFEGNLNTFAGDVMETPIMNLYALEKGLKLYKPDSIVHKDYPWMRCNLDFASDDHLIIGEIKTASSLKQWGEEGTDDIPTEYLLQCAHNRIVAASHYGIDFQEFTIVVCVLGYKKEIREYVYKKNEKLESLLIKKEKEFWLNHVEKQNPPEQTDTKSKNISLDQIIDEAVVADQKALELYERHRKIKQELDDLKEQDETIKTELARYLDNKTLLMDDEGNKLMSWKASITRRFDVSEFKKEMPDIYNKFIKESTIRPMRFI